MDKAIDLKFKGREDAAMRYMKRSFAKEPDERAWCLNYMGDIENKRGNLKEAESNYKAILTTYKDDNYYLQYRAHLKIADVYIKRKDFEGALTYLRRSEEFKYRHGCGTGKYEQEYELCYKYAICFKELNKLDSALKKLSRFMFKDEILLTGRNANMERNRFYYSLLVKKYGDCAVKDELLKAISNFNYSIRPDTSWSHDPKMKKVTCSLSFFGQTIPIADFGYGGAGADIDKYYSKEVFLEGVKSLFCLG